MHPPLIMPMQKQTTGKAAWGHAMCYVMVKSVECVGQSKSSHLSCLC